MTYTIEVRGKSYKFTTLEAAKAKAEAIFAATRIVVGIVAN